LSWKRKLLKCFVVIELATVSFQIFSPSQPISFHTLWIERKPVCSSRAYI